MHEIVIQKVKQLDTGKLLRLVDESEIEGFRHIKRLVIDYENGANKFDKEGEALFIALQNNEIVGVCGLNSNPYESSYDVGRIRRLYVSPRVRRFGIGRMLMNYVIEEARNTYKLLVLRTHNPIADIFYQSLGFSNKFDSENDTHFLQLEQN